MDNLPSHHSEWEWIWCRLSSYGDVLWKTLGNGQRSREDPRQIRQRGTNAWHNLMLNDANSHIGISLFLRFNKRWIIPHTHPRASSPANLISQPKNTRCVKQHELHSEELMFHCYIKPAVPEATAEDYAVRSWNMSYTTHYLDISCRT